MTWEKYDESGTRWTWTADEERHLLLIDVDTFTLREYHEQPDGPVTVHEYAPDDLYAGRSESHADPLSIVYPLHETTHLRTVTVAPAQDGWVRALDDRELWEWLASGDYGSAREVQP